MRQWLDHADISQAMGSKTKLKCGGNEPSEDDMRLVHNKLRFRFKQSDSNLIETECG